MIGRHRSYLVASEECTEDNIRVGHDLDMHSIFEDSNEAYNDSHSSSGEEGSKTKVKW